MLKVTTNMFASVWFLTVMEPVKNVLSSNQQQLERYVKPSGKKKALYLRWTNLLFFSIVFWTTTLLYVKTFNEGIIKTCALACVDSHYKSKIV